MNIDIKPLVEKYPNDAELGSKVREIYWDRIDKINKLYEEGNTITYWTARGSVTKIDWYNVTKKQLEMWGCKYHNLSVGKKPAYDLLICDKAINSEEFFKK